MMLFDSWSKTQVAVEKTREENSDVPCTGRENWLAVQRPVNQDMLARQQDCKALRVL